MDSSDEGTFGRIEVGEISLHTGELPWRENAADQSCIPPGLYPCSYTFSPRLKRKTYLLGITGARTDIRIHSANLMGDVSKGFRAEVEGCIAIGYELGTLGGQKALIKSAAAIRYFEEFLDCQPFELEIIGEQDFFLGPLGAKGSLS
jgi:hypothetical protein